MSDDSAEEADTGELNLPNVKLMRVEDPVPGVWQIHTIASQRHTLRMFGERPYDDDDDDEGGGVVSGDESGAGNGSSLVGAGKSHGHPGVNFRWLRT